MAGSLLHQHQGCQDQDHPDHRLNRQGFAEEREAHDGGRQGFHEGDDGRLPGPQFAYAVVVQCERHQGHQDPQAEHHDECVRG